MDTGSFTNRIFNILLGVIFLIIGTVVGPLIYPYSATAVIAASAANDTLGAFFYGALPWIVALALFIMGITILLGTMKKK